MVVDTLVETFGPFLIPATVFVVGVIGYGILIVLTRYGLLPGRSRSNGGND
ncbi:MAG: hypothetical protein V5A45_02370 [Haloarculaceae archaeon]